MVDENVIGSLLVSLSTTLDNMSKKQYEDTINSLKESYANNEELYEIETQIARMRFDEYAALPFRESHQFAEKDNSKLAIITYMYNGLLEHYLTACIIKAEGSPCSADKVSFIISRIKKALISGENLSLYEEYGDDSRQAYWSPKSFKDTNEAIDRFFKWYKVEGM